MKQEKKQIPKITSAELCGNGRFGSAISREFQSGKQQQTTNTMWRKQKQQQQQEVMQSDSPQQQHIYGFVPFKSAAVIASNQNDSNCNSSSIYSTSLSPSVIHNSLTTATDYMHSIYAPPHLIHQHNRPESSLNNFMNGKHKQHNHGLFGPRPVSDMGMYKLMPSRCQSYTTLPRPEQGLPELVTDEPLLPPFIGTKINHHHQQQKQHIYGIGREDMPFRSASALSGSRSLGRKNSTINSLPPAYFAPNSNIVFNSSQTDFGNDGGHNEYEYQKQQQEMTAWSSISLGSWLTIVFGSAIFCLSAVRLYWRADIVKGSQELFYGISAICAGIMGVLASQHRNFCMLIAAFVHFAINIVFFVPFISGILPLVPFISSTAPSLTTSSSTTKQSPLLSLSGTVNNSRELPVLAGAMVMLSLLQMAAAFSFLFYGCRTFGRTMRHVENIQRQHINVLQQQQQQQGTGGELSREEKDAGGEIIRKIGKNK